MAQINLAYGTNTALGITLSATGMVDGAARESDLVNNNSTAAIDAHVQIRIRLASGTPSGDKAVYVYAYGSYATSELTNPATGSDAQVTIPTLAHNFAQIGTINTATSTGPEYTSRILPLSPIFGFAPRRLAIVVHNKSGLAFSTMSSEHSAWYYPVLLNSA